MGCPDSCASARGVVVDLVKLAPTTGWLVMCCFAIPSYAAIGWVAPVVCAVFSSLLAVLATRDIFMHLSPSIHAYVLVGKLAEREDALTVARAKRKGAVAVAFFCASAACMVVFLVVAYAVIEPEKSKQPCDGECEGCEEDRNCKRWVADVEDDHPVVAICPPTKGSADTDATFSCLADGYWMMVTSVMGLIWVGASYYVVRTARARAADAGPGATELV